ncbi:hypothetical protein EVAR_60082_1 [Eumeta japonica]|uniref:Uncharacterized protein n=1 Tax=Eumeta variegata TaxID=151549 RepID=A0A4C1YMD8_EUMVA|nr:hypothetical protein EVAR_60082_1 [Eumeta japonica]
MFSVIVDGRITTALRGCRCVRRLVNKEIGEGARGSDLIGRAVRDARAREGGCARRTALLYASAARTVSPPSTADEETLSTRVLKRSSGPPSARLVVTVQK